MKRAIVGLVLAGFLAFAVAPSVFAAGNVDAKIQLHVGPKLTKNVCLGGAVACNAIDTNGLLYPPNVYFTYLVVTDYNVTEGLAGLQCGVTYNGALGVGVDVFTWTLCAALEFPSDAPNAWPSQPPCGNLISWDSTTQCQQSTNAAVAGYFYMGAYSPDVLQVTTRPVDNLAKAANCSSVEDILCTGGGSDPAYCHGPSHLGSAAFNGAGTGGYSPCGLATPVENKSWGSIKSIYQ